MFSLGLHFTDVRPNDRQKIANHRDCGIGNNAVRLIVLLLRPALPILRNTHSSHKLPTVTALDKASIRIQKPDADLKDI